MSIRASREGRDGGIIMHMLRLQVSIHASREGRDMKKRRNMRLILGFNPRVPRGTRREHCAKVGKITPFQSTRPARDATNCNRHFNGCVQFQSTRPARDATSSLCLLDCWLCVSIHASREGRDTSIIIIFQEL